MTKFDEFVADARREDGGPFDPPPRIVCPKCDGDLMFTRHNRAKTLAFIECQGECKQAYTVRHSGGL